MGRPREELGAGLRSVVSGRYIIFYVVREGEIEIARVIHGARDIEDIWQSSSDLFR